MTLKLKLAAAFSVVLLLTTIIGIFAIVNLSSLDGETKVLANRAMPSIDAANRINTAISDLRAEQYAFTGSSGRESVQSAEEKVKKSLESVAKMRAAFEKLMSAPEERNIYSQFSADFDKYVQKTEEIIPLFRQKKNA